MPKVIQFTHPGGEHKPDNSSLNHKDWNEGLHARKFLLSDGYYVKDNQLEFAKLQFWGEWEPPSNVKKIEKKVNQYSPNWLHTPYLPSELPNNFDGNNSYQNTDPLVFGNEFRYFLCKQYQDKKKRTTTLAKLESGDIILFGSSHGAKKENAFFQLDTVFVISHYIEYDISDINALNDYRLGIYREFVFKMAFPTPSNYPLKLRLYFGANYNNQINGVYSFSPCKPLSNNIGFPRVQLKNIKYLTNNLNAAPKITQVTIEESITFWKTIQEATINQGCFEGVMFSFPVII